MSRNRWPLLMCMVLCGILWACAAMAQSQGEPTDHSLQAVGASDTQVSTSTMFVWMGGWSLGQFGLYQFHGWGLAPARSWSGRTSVAVLRERRGLLH